jgi:hypothetical protein
MSVVEDHMLLNPTMIDDVTLDVCLLATIADVNILRLTTGFITHSLKHSYLMDYRIVCAAESIYIQLRSLQQ